MPNTLASLRQQLMQLQTLREQGTLSETAHAEARDALERRIVDAVLHGAVDEPGAAKPSGAAAPRAGSALLLWATPVAVVVLIAAAAYWWKTSSGPGAATLAPVPTPAWRPHRHRARHRTTPAPTRLPP